MCSIIRHMMICVAAVVCVMLVPLGYGLDLKYYYYLNSNMQRHVCEDAVRANPSVVKQLQSIAERHVKLIQSELAALAKSNPCLAGISEAQIEVPSANETGRVLCGLEFRKSTHLTETMSETIQGPDKKGCVLYVWVHNILASRPPERSSDFIDWFLVHEIEIHEAYLLRLSEQNKDLDKTARMLIDQRVKEMCDEMKKLQTAQDKAAAKKW